MGRLAWVVLLVGCYAPRTPAGAPCADGVCPIGLVCAPATSTCERAGGDAAAPLDAPAAADAAHDAAADAAAEGGIDAPPDASSGFAYRRQLTIHNVSSGALPAGFTIRVRLDGALALAVAQGKVQPDLSDLRVFRAGGAERDRIVDGPGGPAPAAASFALAAPIAAGATDTTYALYYGDPTAGAPPASGTAVFPVYDDFDHGIASTWLQHDAPSTSGGQLVLRAGHTDALTTTAAADGLPIVSAVELVATIADPTSDPTAQPDGTFYYWFGYQHTGDFDASDPWVVWIARGKGQLHGEQKSPVGCEGECDGPDTGQDTAPHAYAIERDPGQTRFYRDGALVYTAPVMNSEDYAVIVRNFMATSDVRIDWVRARARVSPDPLVTVGPEQAP